jgi:hypothetical protein
MGFEIEAYARVGLFDFADCTAVGLSPRARSGEVRTLPERRHGHTRKNASQCRHANSHNRASGSLTPPVKGGFPGYA